MESLNAGMPVADDMFLSVNRPQYISVPEGFISSLAWKLFELKQGGDEDRRTLPLALMFLADEKAPAATFELRTTAPEGEKLIAFGDALKEKGIGPQKISSSVLGSAVKNSVTGIRAEKSTLQAASPVSPGFALLQNMRGVQKSAGPPDLAEILETLYKFGLPAGSLAVPGVADRWRDAAEQRLEDDILLSALDGVARDVLVGQGLQDKGRETQLYVGQGLFPQTPFAWFVRSWDRLTSPIWVDALPARVWVDWATTILRLTLGMGFLWEAAWYESLGRRVLSGDPFSWEELRRGVPSPLPWKSSRASKSVRDVASLLVWRVHKGASIRKELQKWLSGAKSSELSFDEAMNRMVTDANLKDKITAALGSQRKTAPNTWEAIKYALLTRDVAGPYADYYGMLRQNGRFLTVEPGTEWIAVVASLACVTPGGEANVGQLMSDLRDLGLHPELADIVALLERAGLARGSADADQGVLIKSAF